MPVPHIQENFGDLLDIDFQRIFHDNYNAIPPMLATLFNLQPTNGRDVMKFSQVGTLPDWQKFEGSVNYTSMNQGFDTVLTPIEFTNGIQVERLLFENDQQHIMNARPKALATSATRTREIDAAAIWNQAFSVANDFFVNSEAVAMCSNSHLTTSDASTASGFDNLGTAALSATAVAAARIAMRGFRDDQAGLISVLPDEIVHPPNLYEEAFEITNASGKVDTADNNPNVHHGQYTTIDWDFLNDTNNWFLQDSRLRKDMVHWTDRIPMEFAFAEGFDDLIAKWRGYMVYAMGWTDWRFVFGHQVS